MIKCIKCGFYDLDSGCTCPSIDKWYACPVENEKPENIQLLEEYAEWIKKKGERNDI